MKTRRNSIRTFWMVLTASFAMIHCGGDGVGQGGGNAISTAGLFCDDFTQRFGAPNANALPGVWNANFVDPTFGPASVQLAIQGNGAFSQQYVYAAGSVLTFTGTIRVVQNPPILRLDILDWSPKEFGGNPVGPFTGETDCLGMTGNVMVLRVAQSGPGGLEIVYQR